VKATRIIAKFTDLSVSNTRKAVAQAAKRAAKKAKARAASKVAERKARQEALAKLGQPLKRRPRIQDEFTGLPVSRQRKYQLRKLKERRCIICGEPAALSHYCTRHAVAARERQRAGKGRARRYTNSRTYRLEAFAALEDLTRLHLGPANQ